MRILSIFNRHKNNNQNGFTIIELLIATAVFSVILLVVSVGIVRIGQYYFKGIVQSRTQETTRSTAEDISRSIQLADGEVKNILIPNPDDASNAPYQGKVCVGDVRYTYYLDQEVTSSSPTAQQGLIAEKIDSVNCAGSAGTESRQLLGNSMRLLRFNIKETDPGEKNFTVDIKLAYGDDDLLSHYNDNLTRNANSIADANCKAGVAVSSFCATSELDILVKRRLNKR